MNGRKWWSHRIARSAAGLLLLLGVAGCRDLLVRPARPDAAGLALAVAVERPVRAASSAAAAHDQTDQVRIRLLRDETAVVDLTRDFDPAAAELTIRVEVDLEAERETLRLELSLLAEGRPIFAASRPVALEAGATTRAEIAPAPVPGTVELDPARPEAADALPGGEEAYAGSDAVRIRISRDGAPVVDTVAPFSPAAADPRVRLEVALEAAVETLALEVELLAGGYRLFRDSLAVEVHAADTTAVTAALEPLIGPVEPALDVAAGNWFTCALNGDGLLFCWGRSELRVRNETTPPFRTEPVLAAFWPRFVEVTAGDHHACARTAAGAAHCWGSNLLGQLGDGTTANRDSPAPVAGGAVFESVAAGTVHNCGVAADGRALCWGGGGRFDVAESGGGLGFTPPDRCAHDNSYYGQACSTQPRPVDTGLTFSRVSPGVFFTCGVTGGGEGYCWGWDFYSQLGVGADTVDSYPDPQPVRFAGTFRMLEAGTIFACGLDTDGAAHCWGNLLDGESPVFDYGQLGDGRFDGGAVPEPVVGGHRFRALALPVANSIYAAFACAIDPADQAWCWGINHRGQLGTRGGETCEGGPQGQSVDCTSSPVAVSGGHVFRDLDLGANHACGVTLDDSLYCWGGNEFGQLGDGTVEDRHAPTRVVAAAAAVRAVAPAGADPRGRRW